LQEGFFSQGAWFRGDHPNSDPTAADRRKWIVKPDGAERRREPRSKLTQPVRIRVLHGDFPAETCKTSNVSRNGLYFITSTNHYFAGMTIYVTRNYHPDDPMNKEEIAEVVRIDNLKDGRTGVAVRIGKVVPGGLID
jgi:PilZ domain